MQRRRLVVNLTGKSADSSSVEYNRTLLQLRLDLPATLPHDPSAGAIDPFYCKYFCTAIFAVFTKFGTLSIFSKLLQIYCNKNSTGYLLFKYFFRKIRKNSKNFHFYRGKCCFRFIDSSAYPPAMTSRWTTTFCGTCRQILAKLQNA